MSAMAKCVRDSLRAAVWLEAGINPANRGCPCVTTEPRQARRAQQQQCLCRLSTVRDADVILVMRKGQIIERGSHDELTAADGSYAALVKRQLAARGSRASLAAHASSADLLAS